MPKYTCAVIETRQYRATVEAKDEDEAYDIVYGNYYEGLYNEQLEQHPCGMEIYNIREGKEVR